MLVHPSRPTHLTSLTHFPHSLPPLTPSLPHSLTHSSLTHALMHSRTHALTRSRTQPGVAWRVVRGHVAHRRRRVARRARPRSAQSVPHAAVFYTKGAAN